MKRMAASAKMAPLAQVWVGPDPWWPLLRGCVPIQRDWIEMLSCTHNLHMSLSQALLERVLAQRTIFQRFRIAKRVLLQVSRTVFLPITPEGVRIPGAIAPFGDKAPNCRSETNPATPPGLFAARQKNPQAILPNAPPQGDKVGGRRFFSRQDAAENGQD